MTSALCHRAMKLHRRRAGTVQRIVVKYSKWKCVVSSVPSQILTQKKDQKYSSTGRLKRSSSHVSTPATK
jgi:hypothetical protein